MAVPTMTTKKNKHIKAIQDLTTILAGRQTPEEPTMHTGTHAPRVRTGTPAPRVAAPSPRVANTRPLRGWQLHQTISRHHRMSSETCHSCTSATLATTTPSTSSPTMMMMMTLWWPAIAAHVVHHLSYQLATYLHANLQTVRRSN